MSEVAKVRASLFVKRDPRFETFDLEILEIDVALQVQSVEIFNPDRGQEAIDLSELLAGLRVVEFDARHLDGLRRKSGVKLANLSADAVVCKRLFDLVGNVAIDVSQAETETGPAGSPQAHQRRQSARPGKHASSEVTPTLSYGRLLFYTHNLQPRTRLGEL